MSRPWLHPKTGTYYFRRRIPKDLVTLVGRKIEKVSLRTKSVAEAKHRFAAHALETEARWANLRTGYRSLSLIEIHSIAGEFYRTRIEIYRQGEFSPFFNFAAGGVIHDYIENGRDEAARARYLELFGKEIESYLSDKGLLLDTSTRKALDYSVAKALSQAIGESFKYMGGDFSPDPDAGRFPQIAAPPARPEPSKKSLAEWFDACLSA
ncbi:MULTISPECIES: DUF6538 domain-containing protein [unclassified Aurantimonas]|nr:MULTISPECIES: DUF6538 domain-containing protein [unclassified Aurantimonas]MEC5293771.1 DUF6538 domain-containing protein [Aurantimonas sp. C2-3-R2]MEC5414832.1 DUF6538 domain-containing protein [Aurantimonas sp. C2-4-R8]